MDYIDELARALSHFPGIGPRQGKRFVYYLLTTSATERAKLARLIKNLDADVHQCSRCMRFYTGNKTNTCRYCSDTARDNAVLMIIEKDQDLTAIERAGTYHGKYFVLGGVLTLSGKGTIYEKELLQCITKYLENGLKEVVLALSATSEGEHTADYVRTLLSPYRTNIKISMLGRGLATGSELEYSDAETLRAAFSNRKET